ncbi:hypothetical protein [Adhaeribacter terrigena]|nr:hypothetical protein [Adhaeribacter terrigena]
MQIFFFEGMGVFLILNKITGEFGYSGLEVDKLIRRLFGMEPKN